MRRLVLNIKRNIPDENYLLFACCKPIDRNQIENGLSYELNRIKDDTTWIATMRKQLFNSEYYCICHTIYYHTRLK